MTGIGPTILIIRLLEACDAGCFMCGFAFSRDTFRFALKDAQRLAVASRGTALRIVRFTGGEPLLHLELPDVIRAFAEEGLLTSVITNGGRLREHAESLVQAGLSQVVVSLDGPDATSHDRFRRKKGLFEDAIAGLENLRERSAGVRRRVNTVAGPHNFEDLGRMHDLLTDLGVQDWSIIPLKRHDAAWRFPDPWAARRAYARFQDKVANSTRGPRIVGLGASWMGRTPDEIDHYLSRGRPMTPRGICRVVDRVRYYVPAAGTVFPCNCVPHRLGATEFGAVAEPETALTAASWPGLTWLRENGSAACAGCEPANVALGELDGLVADDPYLF